MNIFYNILAGLICLIVGYLFGCIQISIIIGKVKFNTDIREHGSGNAGATNARRLWGKKIGNLVTFLDVLKSIIAVVLCFIILTYVPFGGKTLAPTSSILMDATKDASVLDNYVIKWPAYYMANIGVIIGHCWPMFNQFRGGKGASSFFGGNAICSWLFGLMPFFLYLVIRKKTKIVSISVLIAGFTSIILAWIFTILVAFNVIPSNLHWIPTWGPYAMMIPFWYAAQATISFIIVTLRHHKNIKDLLNGTERITK